MVTTPEWPNKGGALCLSLWNVKSKGPMEDNLLPPSCWCSTFWAGLERAFASSHTHTHTPQPKHALEMLCDCGLINLASTWRFCHASVADPMPGCSLFVFSPIRFPADNLILRRRRSSFKLRSCLKASPLCQTKSNDKNMVKKKKKKSNVTDYFMLHVHESWRIETECFLCI